MAASLPRIFLFLMLACGHATAAVAAPSAVAASYEVLFNGLRIAAIDERFATGNGTYRIVSESKTVGLLALFRKQSAVLVSSGRLGAAGLSPEHFEGSEGDNDARRVSARFDWPAQQLTLDHDGKSETAPLPPGTQDRISLMYQLMFVAFDRLRQFDVAMTNGRKIDQYRYAIAPDVEIDTPLGRMKTLHLVKERQPNESAAEIWVASEHNFFPVKVLIVEKDGSRYEQIVTRLAFKP